MRLLCIDNKPHDKGDVTASLLKEGNIYHSFYEGVINNITYGTSAFGYGLDEFNNFRNKYGFKLGFLATHFAPLQDEEQDEEITETAEVDRVSHVW